MQKVSSFLAASILGISVLGGSLYSYLFVNESIGLSFPVFTLFMIIAVELVKYIAKGAKGFSYYDLLFIPIFILSLFTVWHQNDALLILNGLVISFLFLPIVYFSFHSDIYKRFSFLNAHLVYLHNFVSGLIGIPRFLKVLFVAGANVQSKSKRSKVVILNILVGCVIAFPIVLLFTGLFVLADDAFKEWLGKIDVNIGTGHVIVSIIITILLLYSFIGIFVGKLKNIYVDQSYDERSRGITAIISSVVLFSLNLLFIFFILIQFVYLFGDHDKVVDLGMTYSEYAVKGFWELQVVSILAFGLIYFLKRFTVAKSRNAKVFTKSLIGLFIINVLVVIFSAHTRMNLYESGYGYTELRLFTHTFMGMEACLFAYLFLSNLYRPLFKFFSLYALIIGFIFLFGLNILKPDWIIGYRNINRYEEGKQLDVEYLLSLSSDAYLQLEDVDFETKEIYLCELTQKREEIEKSSDSWKEFNYSKKSATDQIDDLTKGYDTERCNNLVEELVNKKMGEYSDLIEAEDYGKAKEYWNFDGESLNLVNYIPEEIDITDYQIDEASFYYGKSYDNALFNKNDGPAYYYSDFGTYAYLSAKLHYGNDYNTNACKTDTVVLVLANGKALIGSSEVFPLFVNDLRYTSKDYYVNLLKELDNSSYTYSTCY